jgi:hypothetical protein
LKLPPSNPQGKKNFIDIKKFKEISSFSIFAALSAIVNNFPRQKL